MKELTPEAMEAIRRADVANIIKAQKAGRKLTAADRRMLEDAMDTSTLGCAENYQQATKRTGFSRQTLRMIKEAGCDAWQANGRIDCDKVLEFAAAHPALLENSGESVSYETERAMHERIKRMMSELELAAKRGELVSMEEVHELFGGWFGPIRQQFLSLPAAMAHRCNPTDPEMARFALEEWVEASMKLIREHRTS